MKLMTRMFSHAGLYGVVADLGGGRVVGSNFLDERNCIAGVGPITVDPSVQNKMVGPQLMEDVHQGGTRRIFPVCRPDTGRLSHAFALPVCQARIRRP